MITADEMRDLEQAAVQGGISIKSLMTNAGTAVAETILKKFDVKDKKILVVCYHGNNGGDGLVTANTLADKAEVEVLFLGDDTRLKEEAMEAFKEVEDNTLIQFIGIDFVDFDEYDIIVDAILGTGIEGELKPIIQSTIDHINASKATKVSVDVPTGLNPDTGKVEDRVVNADLIITFHDIKKGLPEGKTEIVDIRIPRG